MATTRRRNSDNGKVLKKTLSQLPSPEERYVGCGSDEEHANLAKTVKMLIHTNQKMPRRTRTETLSRREKERAKEKAKRAKRAKVKERKETEEAVEEAGGDIG